MEMEWLILSDAAQVVGGKLFLMGGGWDTLTIRTEFPVTQHMGVALAFRVPWNETNQRRPFTLQMQDDDGKVLVTAGGQFEVGRPPGAKQGQDQRMQFAANLITRFTDPGSYVIVVTLDSEEAGRFPFRVLDGRTGPTVQAPGA